MEVFIFFKWRFIWLSLTIAKVRAPSGCLGTQFVIRCSSALSCGRCRRTLSCTWGSWFQAKCCFFGVETCQNPGFFKEVATKTAVFWEVFTFETMSKCLKNLGFNALCNNCLCKQPKAVRKMGTDPFVVAGTSTELPPPEERS